MEQVHGIDVAWLHHNQREHDKFKRPQSKNTSSQTSAHTSSAPTPRTTPPPPPELRSDASTVKTDAQSASQVQQPMTRTPSNGQHALSSSPSSVPTSQPTAIPGKRRSLLGLGRSTSSSDRVTGSSPEETRSKKSSWMSSFSSKFSSSSSNSVPTLATADGNDGNPAVGLKGSSANIRSASPAPSARSDDGEDSESGSYSQSPKPSGLLNAFRKFTPSTAVPQLAGKQATTGTLCPRQILNVDRGRERCKVKELDTSRMKRVAFSVDVEIAGAASYGDDIDGTPVDATKKEKDMKQMARSEGAALKQVDAATINQDTADESTLKAKPATSPSALSLAKSQDVSLLEPPRERHDSFNSVSSSDLGVDDTDWDLSLFSTSNRRPSGGNTDFEARAKRRALKEEKARRKNELLAAGHVISPVTPVTPGFPDTMASTFLNQTNPNKPTTDPVRMYRRCCQLREAPVLKRISEQLSNPKTCHLEPRTNIVGLLDLRGSRMQLPDVQCLGDWLSIVPVRRLLLDNANLSDEGLRHILAGLLAAKLPKHRKRPGRVHHNNLEGSQRHQGGVVEKLSLRNNPKITAQGWRDLCTFINLSKSIHAIDVSLVPFPQSRPSNAAVVNGNDSDASSKSHQPTSDISLLLCKSLSSKSSDSKLIEFIMGDCNLQTHHIKNITQGAKEFGLQRFGVARNNLTREGLQYIADYIRTGVCQGVDIGGNDLSETMPILVDAISSTSDSCPLWALSLARCNLSPATLNMVLPAVSGLMNFRFLDISHNRDLFSSQANALAMLRKHLPRLKYMRRLHLIDVGLTAREAIGLAEIMPEMRNINHISLLDNESLKDLASNVDSSAQEELCALYSALMVAVKVSKTLLAVDLEVPASGQSDVVKALNKQIIAYCLRNLERFMSADAMRSHDPASVIPDEVEPDKEAQLPDILVHLVGSQDYACAEAPAHGEPDQDYIVAGTGMVKALQYVLGQQSTDASRPSTGRSTPVNNHPSMSDSFEGRTKAKEGTKFLLQAARKVRSRLQPVLDKEVSMQGTEDAYFKRLEWLDKTLAGMIERFEVEFPDCRVLQERNQSTMPMPSTEDQVVFETAREEATEAFENASQDTSNDGDAGASWPPKAWAPSGEDEENALHSAPDSRRQSTTSLHNRALAQEESYMHKFGQTMRRNVLPPVGMDDHLHGTREDSMAEAEHLAMLRSKLEELGGEEIRNKVVKQGLEATVREWFDQSESYRHPASGATDGHDTGPMAMP